MALTRDQRIAVTAIVVSALGIVIALINPEVRQYLGLAKSQQSHQAAMSGPEPVAAQPPRRPQDSPEVTAGSEIDRKPLAQPERTDTTSSKIPESSGATSAAQNQPRNPTEENIGLLSIGPRGGDVPDFAMTVRQCSRGDEIIRCWGTITNTTDERAQVDAMDSHAFDDQGNAMQAYTFGGGFKLSGNTTASLPNVPVRFDVAFRDPHPAVRTVTLDLRVRWNSYNYSRTFADVPLGPTTERRGDNQLPSAVLPSKNSITNEHPGSDLTPIGPKGGGVPDFRMVVKECLRADDIIRCWGTITNTTDERATLTPMDSSVFDDQGNSMPAYTFGGGFKISGDVGSLPPNVPVRFYVAFRDSHTSVKTVTLDLRVVWNSRNYKRTFTEVPVR